MNPIIIGIVAGFVWSALKLPMPTILHKVVSNVGATATPMGLMSMGATFEMKKATSKMKPTLVYEAGWILCDIFADGGTSWI